MTAGPATGAAPGVTLDWSEPAPDQFEFWHGTWRAETVAGGAEPRSIGVNRVTWLWARTALLEDFAMPTAQSQFFGRSISVPVAGRGWCQTWVDSDGQYLDFVGGRVGDEMIMERTSSREGGGTVRQRMRWWDIGSVAFSWDWLHASGGAAEWTLDWRLRYSRAPG